ncbi:hypothetical protein FHU37_002496 [Allostreptomyces psammosilenae]|uniref:Uncharacterized protein n=1 Tax=Allostreptomyces psammosilenae TaxID=1892865 RepID=A0A852ZT21_9ACTN|nr:hypothetical protein [Allostreptomyces psammosilenae]
MARLKKPDLPSGPLRDLNAALHDLHQRAGLPSVRELERSVGAQVASRSRIHDAFTNSRLPAWGLLQVLVRALAQAVPGGDVTREEKRFHTLWFAASDAPRHDEPDDQGTDLQPGRSAGAILAMRVEWARRAWVGVEPRRYLRQYVTDAVEDTGYRGALVYRHDGSAGTTVALVPSREHPSLTAATFLATLDFEHRGRAEELRFMAHLALASGGSPRGLPELEQVITDLEFFCSSPILESYWPKAEVSMYLREHPVSAIVHGIDVRGTADFWGGWSRRQVVLPSRPGAEEFWCREHADTPF